MVELLFIANYLEFSGGENTKNCNDINQGGREMIEI